MHAFKCLLIDFQGLRGHSFVVSYSIHISRKKYSTPMLKFYSFEDAIFDAFFGVFNYRWPVSNTPIRCCGLEAFEMFFTRCKLPQLRFYEFHTYRRFLGGGTREWTVLIAGESQLRVIDSFVWNRFRQFFPFKCIVKVTEDFVNIWVLFIPWKICLESWRKSGKHLPNLEEHDHFVLFTYLKRNPLCLSPARSFKWKDFSSICSARFLYLWLVVNIVLYCLMCWC